MSNDTFISCKNLDEHGVQTRDSEIAAEVYKFLTGKGLSVFLSTFTLEQLGASAYTREIDSAPESATVLLAIGTSADSPRVHFSMNAYHDAHNHLQHPALRPHLAEILSTVRALPVNWMVVNGTAESDWEKVAEMAKELSFVIPSFGLHPWFLSERSKNWEEALRTYLTQTSCAVGEVGLDLWMQNSDLQLQKKILRTHLELAAEFQRPITIHCLRAWSELLELLPTVPIPNCGFLLHSYGGSTRMIEKFLPFGSYFSFSGYFLSRGKEEKAQTFREVPYDRLLVETDAPDMPLPAERNQFPLPTAAGFERPNHPANIQAVVRGLAEILKTPENEVQRTVGQNFYRLFEDVIPSAPSRI